MSERGRQFDLIGKPGIQANMSGLKILNPADGQESLSQSDSSRRSSPSLAGEEIFKMTYKNQR
jgi:hypothetical protein